MANYHREILANALRLEDIRLSRKLALLDRDGTVIVNKHYLDTPDGIEFPDGAIEGLKLLQQRQYSMQTSAKLLYSAFVKIEWCFASYGTKS